MSTPMRPELSNKNPYWISRHRYYELKHFCLQYPEWKKKISDISYLESIHIRNSRGPRRLKSTTEDKAMTLYFYSRLVSMVEKAANETDDKLGDYILKAVTEGISYDTLYIKYHIPCSKSTYYMLYRKFFYILDKLRD